AAAWTGADVAVWGGRFSGSVQISTGRVDCVSTLDLPGCPDLADGAFYDPAADRWTPMNSAGAPAARHGHLVVWTGGRMLVWGGRTGMDQSPYGGARADGGVYDRASGTWTATAAGPFTSADLESRAVRWTGRRLAVVGNGGTRGAIYDAAADAWTDLPA